MMGAADRHPARVNPRTFTKTAGAAGVGAGGIEGILASRPAPALAQGTKLHWVRWVDFIPESDVELKRQMPEASKALGAEVTLETIKTQEGYSVGSTKIWESNPMWGRLDEP